MCHDNEEWCKIWRGIGYSVQDWHEEFEKFCMSTRKSQKNCNLMGCFWPKYIIFELKRYRGVVFDDTEYWCKIWRKTDLCFQKWHEQLSKFLPGHVRKPKNWEFEGSFYPKWKMYELKKFTGELCAMAIKNDAKCEEELTCQFKIDMRNLTNVEQSIQKYQKFGL